jgi:restriction system protein
MAIPKFQYFLNVSPLQLKDKSGAFLQGAREFVSKATSKIVLIDDIVLAKYMIEFNVGVSTRKTYEVKRIDTDYFEE